MKLAKTVLVHGWVGSGEIELPGVELRDPGEKGGHRLPFPSGVCDQVELESIIRDMTERVAIHGSDSAGARRGGCHSPSYHARFRLPEIDAERI
jgi:hypothetical protein